jgi:voltage-gated potassium channel
MEMPGTQPPLKFLHKAKVDWRVGRKGCPDLLQSQKTTIRRWLATIFEDEEPRGVVTQVFNFALASLIVANVAAVVLESVEPIGRRFYSSFETFEYAATAIFAAEYVLRVWACVDFRGAAYGHPFWGRLRYMRSFFALVDAVAIAPAILGILGAADLRVLRLLRLLRMLKLIRHSTTFGLLGAVLRDETRSIAALLFVLLLTVTVSGSLMYMLEGDEQPAVFTSIPAGMWWAIETLTTVGYGDMVPETVVGRILGGVVSIVGIGTLALFSGLITVGFLEQLKLHRRQRSASAIAAPAKRPPHLRTAQIIGRRLELAALPVTALDQVEAPEPRLAVCPHCGCELQSRDHSDLPA